MRRVLHAFAAGAAAVLVAAAPAQAEEGVHVDPESPAGFEYALPLPQARGGDDPDPADQRTPRESETAGGDERNDLFGAGITPDNGDGRSAGAPAASGQRGRTPSEAPEAAGSPDRRNTRPGERRAGEAGLPARVPASTAATADDDGSALGGPLLLIAAILVAGGTLGFLARRRVVPH